ncbi:SICA antigen [Plasmodium coatneyi]|uniref:SICA antigen n=1 Tax=Plasmodium coatneyi TaxID=208452 RepID=A0A1B1E1I4_9APIC|nr:SICA antigen [Plasmodium coatneyi]ANQ08888.1 SICA antigen [Plasmodium coatneyi]
MAPQKTSEYEQDHTKVEEEAGDEVTCTNSDLQQRLRTLIDNWHKDKGKKEKDWKTVWKEILQMVEPLSKDISNYKASMEETYCKNPKDPGTTWTEADRNACMLITAGLKHIYEINVDTSKKGDQANINNRNFRATAACIILNELIRKLKDKEKSCTQRISIEAGIEQAFKVSKEIKGTVCKKDPTCFECQQQNYSDCKMGKEQVREKLKEKFNSDKKIQEALGDIYPPSKPNSTSGTATLTEWFPLFSKDVNDDDKENYEELKTLLILCESLEGELGTGMGKYVPFCEVMMKNIMLVTGVPKEYKNKKGQTPCEKKVKNIPLCDLLKAWMWYMHWFCVPSNVIEYVLKGANGVRKDFISKGEKYEECAYDSAFKIPVGDRRYTVGEAHELFSKSTLHTMMKGLTKKEWCENDKWEYRIRVPEDPIKARVDEDEEDRIISSNDNKNNVDEIVHKIEEGLKQEDGGGVEEEEERGKSISSETDETKKKIEPQEETVSREKVPPREEDPPREEGELDDVVEDDEEEEEAESETASENPDQTSTSDTKAPEQQDTRDTQGESKEEATHEDEPALPKGSDQGASTSSSSSSSSSGTEQLGAGGQGNDAEVTPTAASLTDKIDLPTPYLPLIPSVTGILVMSYLLWKYFGMLRKTRKRYRRAYKVHGPSLEQQMVDHVEQQDGPREYYIVKERKPRSTPIKRRKKRADGRSGRRRGVLRRMIIDIHLEVLDECQRGDTDFMKEDFLKIIVEEFMGLEFIKEENVPKEEIPLEQVPSSDSGFREEDFVPKERVQS